VCMLLQGRSTRWLFIDRCLSSSSAFSSRVTMPSVLQLASRWSGRLLQQSSSCSVIPPSPAFGWRAGAGCAIRPFSGGLIRSMLNPPRRHQDVPLPMHQRQQQQQQQVRYRSNRSRRGLYDGKDVRSGNNVSFSMKSTKRKFKPNVQVKRVYSEILDDMIKFHLTTSTLRSIDKAGGLDSYLLKNKKTITEGEGYKIRKKIEKRLKNRAYFERKAAAAAASSSSDEPSAASSSSTET